MNEDQCLSTAPVEYEETGPRYSASYLAKVERFQQFSCNRYSENFASGCSDETNDGDGDYDRSVKIAPVRDFVEEDDKETENIEIPDRLCQPESPTVACCVNNVEFGDGDTGVLECQPATELYFKSVSNLPNIVTLERQSSEDTEITFGTLGPMNKMGQEIKESAAMHSRSRSQVSGWAKLFSSTLQRSKSTVTQEMNPPMSKNVKMRSGRKSEQVPATILCSNMPATNVINGIDTLTSKAEMRKKKRSIGIDVREKLGFFRKPFGDTGSLIGASVLPNLKASTINPTCLLRLESVWRSTGGPPTRDQIMSWSRSFEDLLFDKHGMSLFLDFLRSEFSEENLEFWSECQKYRSIGCPKKLQQKATQIYEDYVAEQSPKEINIDSVTRIQTSLDICHATSNTFDQSQKKIQALMEKDSYQRFLRSDIYNSVLLQLNVQSSALLKLSHANSDPIGQQQSSRVSYIPGLLPNVKFGHRSNNNPRLLSINVNRSHKDDHSKENSGQHRSAPSSPKDKMPSTIP